MAVGNSFRIHGSVDDKVTKPIKGIRDAFARLQKDGGKGLAIGVGAAVTTKAFDVLGGAIRFVTDQVGKSIQAASNLNEQVSKSEVVFGDAADEIQAFAKTAADSLGLSERAALEAAGGFGVFFTGAGQSAGAAEDMSERMVTLAADLASFNNLDPTEVLQKLRSGLAGEAEPLRSVGVFLTEAKVRAKAMQMGLTDAHGELSEGAKILARYQIILDETGKAQGDFERTSDSLANAERTKNAALENAQARAGKAFLPYATAVEKAETGFLNFVASGLEGWTMLAAEIDGTAQAARELEHETRAMAAAEDNARRAGGALSSEARDLAKSLRSVSDRGGSVSRDIGEMRRRLDNAAASAIGLDGAMENLSDALFGATIRTGDLEEAKQDLDALLRAGPESKSAADMAIWKGQVAEARERVFDLQMQMAQQAGPEAFRSWLLEQKRILKDELNPELSKTIDLLLQVNAQQLSTSGGGKRAGAVTTSTSSTPTSTSSTVTIPRGALPTFAKGGTVPGPLGSPQLVVAHGGEEVVPSGAGGGLTVVFNSTWPPTPAQAREIARVVLSEADFRRGRGSFVPV
jgi:hypothetical protein